MSRVGKHEVIVPAGITLSQAGNIVTIKGKTASKDYVVPDCINYEKTEKGFLISPKEKSQRGRSLWGTTQRNLANIVKGFDKGFVGGKLGGNNLWQLLKEKQGAKSNISKDSRGPSHDTNRRSVNGLGNTLVVRASSSKLVETAISGLHKVAMQPFDAVASRHT
jgi:hypothetical protein